MKQIITLAFALTLAVTIQAQQFNIGHLTVFSEDGDKFFLILNGERQNNAGETNLRIEDLTATNYSAKVIFEDKSLGEITRNLFITDESGVLMDVTYRIKRDKAGKPKLGLMPFSIVPVRQGFVPPANTAVVHFGQPAPAVAVVPVPAATTTVTQTTTTRTGTEAVNVNVGLPGVGMNVTIVDPLLGMDVATTTTTTRTTTTTTGFAEPMPGTPPPPRNVGCNGSFAMNNSNFQSALASINKQGFDETKLSTAKSIAGNNCLSANQIAQVCRTFGFEQTKLDFAKFAYGRCADPANYFTVNDVFGFSSSVEELNRFTSGF